MLQLWNETYVHFNKVDPKQTYYLSMEYLQGRALTNAIGNLNLQGPYADALRTLGYELEEIAEQVHFKLPFFSLKTWDLNKLFFDLSMFACRRKMQL